MHQGRLKFVSTRCLIGVLAIGFAAFGWGEQFQLSATPVFGGLDTARPECVPLRVQISNSGSPTDATLHVNSGLFNMDYPVKLAGSGLTSVNVYPVPGQTGAGGVYIELSAGGHGTVASTNFRFRQFGNQTTSSFSIGLIGIHKPGDPTDPSGYGDLEFVRHAQWGFNGTPSVGYCLPSDAPDRPVGYSAFKVLMLGNDSSQLSDAAIEAIKAWTLQGGTLVFVGGTRSPAATDPRWNRTVPVTGIHRVPHNEAVLTTNNFFPPFTAYVGKPAAPSVIGDRQGLFPEWQYGLGRAVYMAFDPFSEPFIRWDGRGALFTILLSPALLESSQLVLSSQETPMAIRSALEGSANGNNPFQAELPSTGEVVAILALYFIAVVPLNFLILRKLKRGELAWATAPVLSLGFAGIFFGSAHGLYTAQLSSTTRALMVLEQNEPQGVVIGRSQMYFPHAGSYSLNADGLDSIAMGGQLYDDYGGTQEGLGAQDVGQLRATIQVPNLAFREINFRQRAGNGNWFSVKDAGDTLFSGKRFEVRNNSPYSLVDAGLCAEGIFTPLGQSLDPGERVTIIWRSNTGARNEIGERVARLLMRTNGVGLTGKLVGFNAGPKVGTQIPGSDGTTVVFISHERFQVPVQRAAPAKGLHDQAHAGSR